MDINHGASVRRVRLVVIVWLRYFMYCIGSMRRNDHGVSRADVLIGTLRLFESVL
jgi:hypothetical protein